MIETIDYTINKANLYEQIADTLEQAIVHSGIKAEKLPSEQELSGRFKVSRTVIREALKVLKERGLIDSRNGGGSYISRPNTDNVFSVLNRIITMDNISNDDLHNMRLILETSAAGLAALCIKKAELAHLEFVLEQMFDTTLPLEQRISLDADFHVSIARSSRNVLVGMFVDVMNILLREYMLKGVSGLAGMKKTSVQHRKILDALGNRDPLAAETAMQEHLTASKKDVEKYEEKQKLRPGTARPGKRKKASTALERR
jgi:DNA-binding FadR family transcriptional regulator